MKSPPIKVKAVLFDFDATLTRPGALDFTEIRKAIGCPLNQPILEFIESLPSRQKQKEAHGILDRMEIEAAAISTPNEGAESLIAFLKSKGIVLGILSRNSLASIHRALENFNTVGSSDFDVILTREEPVRPKPSPEGVLLAAERLNVTVEQMIVVGDFLFDIQAGHKAGALTVFLNNPSNTRPGPDEADYVISTLSEVKGIVMRAPQHLKM